MASPIISKCANKLVSVTVKSPISKKLSHPSTGSSPLRTNTAIAATSLALSPSSKAVRRSSQHLDVPNQHLLFSHEEHSNATVRRFAVAAARGQHACSPGADLLRHYGRVQAGSCTSDVSPPPGSSHQFKSESPVIALEFSGTACSALIHSPCRSQRYKTQRRRLYHQNSSDALPVDQLHNAAAAHQPLASVKKMSESRLGSGSFGSVFFGRYDNQNVAIKQLRKQTHSEHSLCAELNAFRLDHPNIVKILTFTSQSIFTQVVFEFVGPKNLQEVLSDIENEPIDFTRRHKFCTQIASALAHCHRNRLLHLDLKPSNVLLTAETDDCKLADFGCSCVLPPDSDAVPLTPITSRLGTITYKAPELLRGLPATIKADVYSYSFVIWQCVTRMIPFENKHVHEIIFGVVDRTLRPSTPSGDLESTDQQLLELASQCWDPTPGCRPDFEQILKKLQKISTFTH